MNDWRNLIHLDNCKEVIRLTMNDMIGIYMKELQYIEDGKKTLGLNPNNDDGVIESHTMLTRFTEYGINKENEHNLSSSEVGDSEVRFLKKLISFCKSHIMTLRDTSFYSMTAEKLDMLAVVLNDNIDFLSELNEHDPDPATTLYIEDCEEALSYIQRLPREN